jgi:diacylglycerol kinase
MHVFRTEQNMRVHLILAALVLALGAFLQISTTEWGLLLLCIGMVLAAECFNSSIERLADRISQEEHYLIRVAKDAAAGGVLMVSLSAAAVGALVFLPKLWDKIMGL